MKLRSLPTLAALLAGAATLSAQAVQVNALVEFWYTQMLDNNLRLNSTAKPGGIATPSTAVAYYDGLSSGRFQENTFAIKRTEISLNGKVSDSLSWYVMFDPNLGNTPTVPNNVLQDAFITWDLGQGFVLKAGQFKMPTTYEATLIGSKDILFFDRDQLNRQFGDKRDRGVWLSYALGDAKGFQGKVNLAVSNGTSDDGSSGKNNDSNAQKDWTFRLEGGYGSAHKFGAYYRGGESNLKDSTATYGTTVPAAWTATGVTLQQIKDNKDKTTLEGVYYAFDNATWHADIEYATGLLGRRFPTLFATAAAPTREYLDQKFTGYAVTGVYKLGNHWLLARYDLLNYNSGDDRYTATNPYKTANGDFSPKYTETTLGYNYLFVPSKSSAGKVKLDYIIRSKNFLVPRAGQTGEQGGNSLVASLEIAF